MAEYAASILKTEALYYRLSRATLRDGVLHLYAGGYAETTITSVQLTNLTEYFRVAYIADRFCDSYQSEIRIRINIVDKEGALYNYTFFPCNTNENAFWQEFQVKAIGYTSFTYRIESDVDVNVSLWELCPEAADINTQTLIDGVQQSLPRLLYDYNTWPLVVENVEATVGVITFRLMDKTDLQGHFLMSFYASDSAILTLRFYTNEIEELFAPLTYDIRKGYNSIGVPHSYLHRHAACYTVMVTAQVTAGSISIPTRGVLFSIDGGYLAQRELEVAIDVQDMAIRQASESNGPDEIWLVGIDAGEVLVRKRDYDETNPNVAWTAVGSMGQGIAAAIEFDGIWTLRPKEHKYTIETEEVPYIFLVNSIGQLWAYHGVFDETPFLLDTGVTQVHACKGYASELYEEQDQGLVVVYLKYDGTAYYRRWYFNAVPREYTWEPAEQIPGTWTSVNIHRLNDYRLSLELSSSEGNVWKYTERTYVGQAVYPESTWMGGVFKDTGKYSSFVGFYSMEQLEAPIQIDYVTYEEHLADPYIEGDQDAVIFTLHINRALFGSERFNSYRNRLTYNNVERIYDVEWISDFTSNETFIKVTANMTLRYIKYTFNVIHDLWLRYWYDDRLYALSSDLSYLLNLTDSFYFDPHENKFLTGPTVRSILYKGMTKRYYGVSDNAQMHSYSGQIAYKALTRQYRGMEEDVLQLAGLTTQNVAYYDIEHAPV